MESMNAPDQNIALIMIDWQKGFDDWAYWGGPRNNLEAENNGRILLEYWRKRQLPIFHIQHASANQNSILAATSPGFDIKDEVFPLPQEPLIRKSVNSGFIGTDLKERLDRQGIQTVVLAGFTTDHCVSTTTRMAGNFGYTTIVVSDATATFPKKGIQGELYSADTMHLTALAQLNGEFAEIIQTDKLLARMEG